MISDGWSCNGVCNETVEVLPKWNQGDMVGLDDLSKFLMYQQNNRFCLDVQAALDEFLYNVTLKGLQDGKKFVDLYRICCVSMTLSILQNLTVLSECKPYFNDYWTRWQMFEDKHQQLYNNRLKSVSIIYICATICLILVFTLYCRTNPKHLDDKITANTSEVDKDNALSRYKRFV